MSTLKQFEGRTVEEALERASAELGPEVSLTDATRDRRGGLFGFFTKERFTVTAVDPNGADAGADRAAERDDVDSFSRVLNAMVEDVADVAERSGESTHSANTGSEPAGPLVDLIGVAARPGVRRTTIDLSEGRRLPNTETANESEVGRQGAHPRQQAALFAGITSDQPIVVDEPPEVAEVNEIQIVSPPTIVSARKSRAEHPVAELSPAIDQARILPPEQSITEAANTQKSGSGNDTPQQTWSIARLEAIGIPNEVLSRLESGENRSDLEWAAALERVIGEILDELEPSPTIHVFGTGLESAGELLVAAVAGLVPDHMLIDEHRVPATATELALAVRECLR